MKRFRDIPFQQKDKSIATVSNQQQKPAKQQQQRKRCKNNYGYIHHFASEKKNKLTIDQ